MAISAIEHLLEEHRLIDEMVDILDISVERLEGDNKPSMNVLGKEIAFCRDFINKMHEAKEEEALIPALHKCGYPLDRGPIWETLEDHRKGRSILRRWIASDKSAKEGQRPEDFIKYASAYSLYLFEHIKEEEKGLFHAAELAITDEGKDELMENYSRLDKELTGKSGKKKYEKMLEELKKELD